MRRATWKERFLAVLLAAALGVTLAGCGHSAEERPDDRSDTTDFSVEDWDDDRWDEADMEDEDTEFSIQEFDDDNDDDYEDREDRDLPSADFSEEDEPQYITCSDCDGTGEFLCPLCEGVGWQIWFEGGPKTTCSLCDGSGYAKCVSCGGKGQVENPDYAGNSGDSGSSGGSEGLYIPPVTLDPGLGDVSVLCPVCSGTGEKLCTGCGGTGNVSSVEYIPDYGFGGGGGTYYGEKMCRQCNGSGRVPCTACGGTGYQ